MTEEEKRAYLDTMVQSALRKLESRPIEEVRDLLGRFFCEVMTGEPYECPGCEYPWPRDKEDHS